MSDRSEVVKMSASSSLIDPAAEASHVMAQAASDGSFELFVPDFDTGARRDAALAFFRERSHTYADPSNGDGDGEDYYYACEGDDDEIALSNEDDDQPASGGEGGGGKDVVGNAACTGKATCAPEQPKPSPFLPDDVPVHESTSKIDGEDEDEDEEDNEDARMETHESGLSIAMRSGMGSAEASEWVLEAILSRRLNKAKEGGPWIYCCKWRGYSELTWETREVMEDAGYIPQLDAFDSRGIVANAVKKRRKQKAIDDDERQQQKPAEEILLRPCHKRSFSMDIIEEFLGAEEWKKASPRDPVADLINSQVPPSIPAAGTSSTTASIIARRQLPLLIAVQNNLKMRIMNFARMNPYLADEFVDRWCERIETHVPILCWHGTSTENLPSIYARSLLVGGTRGVKVRNGTLHGSGVYTSTSGRTSSSYSYGSCFILVCVGLVPVKAVRRDNKIFSYPHFEDESVLRNGDFVIFRDARDVCPLWCLQHDHYASGTVPEYVPSKSESPLVETFPFPFPRPREFLFRNLFKNEIIRQKKDQNRDNIEDLHTTYKRNLEKALREVKEEAAAADRARAEASENGAAPLSERDLKEVSKVLAEVVGHGRGGGGLKKAALKSQPRKVKELLAKFKAEGHMKI